MTAQIKKLKAKNIPVLDSGNVFEKAAFYGLCGLLFLSPFFRGLFFAQDQRVAVIFATIIFWLAALVQFQKKDKKFSFNFNLMDCLVLCLPVAYILSTFNAANYSLAIDEVIENLLYFLVFWSAVRLVTSTDRIEKVFTVIYLSAIGVSLAGLLTASGIIEIKDGFLTSDGGTIASTFQYKNSLASFLTAAIFIGSFLWVEKQSRLPKILLLAGNFLLMTVFFSTQSHGGYIVFAIYMVALWVLAPAQRRFPLIASHLILTTSGFAGSRIFLHYIADKSIASAWACILLGVCVLALGQWLLLKYVNREKEITISLKQLLTLLAAAGLLLAAVVGYYGVFQLLLEKLHMHGAMERLTMYQDGIKMILEKPFLGWGGGGWSEAYSLYQGYGYTARQTHSYFLQLAVETGLTGLFIALAIWVVFLSKAFAIYKTALQNEQRQSMAAALICSTLAIISHAVFDFDLSLAALTITMFTLMACLLSLDNHSNNQAVSKPGKGIHISPGYGLAASTIGTVVILIASLLLISSNNLTTAAVEAIRLGDGSKAIDLTEKAIAMNPLVSENYGIASQLYFALKEPEKAVSYAEKAVDMARYNPDRHLELSRVYLMAGQTEKAVAAAKKAVQLAPLKAVYYQGLSEVLISSAINALKEKNNQTAAKYFKQVSAIPQEMDEVLHSVAPDKKKLWLDIGAEPLAATDKMKLNLGIARLCTGDPEQAGMYINEAAKNPELQKETLVWQALLARRQGDETKVQALLQGTEKDNPQIKEQFDKLSKLIN